MERPAGTTASGDGGSVPGMERCGFRGHRRGPLVTACVRSDRMRLARPRGVPRLPGRAANRRVGRRRPARRQLAGADVLCGPHAGEPRPGPVARHRTQPAMAHVLRRCRHGRREASAARSSSRSVPYSATRRTRGPFGAPVRPPTRCSRPGSGCSGRATRAHRHRGRAARLGAATRLRVGVDLGAGTALRRDAAQPEGDASAARQARLPPRPARSTSPTSTSPQPHGSAPSPTSSRRTPM